MIFPASNALQRTNYLNAQKGWWSWFWTIDHKRLGLMYLWGVFAMFAFGGFFAMMIRWNLATPDTNIWDPELIPAATALAKMDAYNRMFTVHGAVMIFLVIIPGIPAALGNFVLPIMLGAKDVAFPRLNRFSFHLWILGAICFILTFTVGGLDTGWTFYPTYSTGSAGKAVIFATLGTFILGFSSIFTGLNFVVTIHKLRPPGMIWFKMPLFLWAIYATAVLQILATPVIGISMLLLLVEYTMQIGIFTPELGGDPVFFQHLFWFYSHPAVYIMILPAMGVMSELIGTFSRKPIFGYKSIAMSSLAIAVISFIVWGHHMFLSGQSPLMSTIFSFLTFAVAIPSAIKVFNWVCTLYKGSISFATPMLYALSIIWLFGVGGLTGLFLSTMGVDIHLHDTYFVVAHFHFVMVGSAIFAFIGGIYYWMPKMYGRMASEKLGRITWALNFIGFNLTFLPQFVAGTKGMPRRYFDYDPEFAVYNWWSSIGAAFILVGMVLTLIAVIQAITRGRPAPANPWGGVTLEWMTESPPPEHNFEGDPPEVGDPYDVSLVEYKNELDGFVPAKPMASDPNMYDYRASLKAGVAHTNLHP
ncbi:MAG: cbb3-type cytochrome c oxidase subunit I [Planctomycetota bacterium]|nr:cbb3-type cytochrome c oxidase subunit I [Planctomycetota bacterium]